MKRPIALRNIGTALLTGWLAFMVTAPAWGQTGDQEHYLKLLHGGPAVWNAWAAEHATEGVDLSGVGLDDYSFAGADLSGVRFDRAELRNTDFTHADLSGAVLDGADLHNADLTGAKLSRASLKSVKLKNVLLVNADLSGTSLAGADLSGADLAGANLTGADLRGADLRRVGNLETAALAGAIGDATTLVDEDLRPEPTAANWQTEDSKRDP